MTWQTQRTLQTHASARRPEHPETMFIGSCKVRLPSSDTVSSTSSVMVQKSSIQKGSSKQVLLPTSFFFWNRATRSEADIRCLEGLSDKVSASLSETMASNAMMSWLNFCALSLSCSATDSHESSPASSWESGRWPRSCWESLRLDMAEIKLSGPIGTQRAQQAKWEKEKVGWCELCSEVIIIIKFIISLTSHITHYDYAYLPVRGLCHVTVWCYVTIKVDIFEIRSKNGQLSTKMKMHSKFAACCCWWLGILWDAGHDAVCAKKPSRWHEAAWCGIFDVKNDLVSSKKNVLKPLHFESWILTLV